MNVFKTTQEILTRFIDTIPTERRDVSWNGLPPQTAWDHATPLTVSNVKLWEEIYYLPGALGIYAAWDPDAELYVIVHEFFSSYTSGIQTFYGPLAGKQILDETRKLGIDLAINQRWVDKEQLAFYSPLPPCE